MSLTKVAETMTSFKAATVTKLTSTGTTTGRIFFITSGNATIGATYTNNSQTFTVLQTIAAGTILHTLGAGAPQSSGTLTKSAGTGDSTLTFSSAVATATYTPPAGAKWGKLKAVGGGAGGSGGGSGGASPAAATDTFFGSGMIRCIGGSTGGQGANGAIGGDTTIASPFIGIAYRGAPTLGIIASPAAQGAQGGHGGSSIFGGGGGGSWAASGATAAATNSGSGGGGGGCGANAVSGQGGSSGGGVEGIIPAFAASYQYVIGLKTTGGAAGASAGAGGDGADGQIYIEEYYA